MCNVTLTFEVWIRVKVTAHRRNEDNICTKLDGNISMHTLVIEQPRAWHCVLWQLNVLCDFERWIWVKVTAHCFNEENICTKLDGNAYISYRADTKCYGRTEWRTKCIHKIPSPLCGGGLKMVRGDNTVNIQGRIMVLGFCPFPHCHLSIYQVWFKCQQ